LARPPQEAAIVRASEVKLLGSARVERCAYVRKDRDVVATLIVDMPLRARFRTGANVVEYHSLLRMFEAAERDAPDGPASTAARDLVQGKLVFVGNQLSATDEYPLRGWDGGHVWGSELHAHALETLFSNRAVSVLSDWIQVPLLLVCAAAAVALRFWFRRDARRRRAGLFTVLAAIVGLVFCLAVYFDILMDGAYPMVSAVLSYLVSRRYISQWSAHVTS
jgi:hypothetical protein